VLLADVKLHGAPRRFFSATFSAFQVVDQVIRIFQADGQADQPWVMLASASSAMRKWWCWPVITRRGSRPRWPGWLNT
jgi:hypothetical protein